MPPTALDHQPITASEEDRPALIKLEDLFDQLEPESVSFQLVSNSGVAIDIPAPVFNLIDRKSTRLNSSHRNTSRMPSSA